MIGLALFDMGGWLLRLFLEAASFLPRNRVRREPPRQITVYICWFY